MAASGKVTPKQRQLIVALLTASSVAAAAKTASVAERTAYRWMTQPAFRAELDAATKDAIGAVVRRLASLSLAATSVLGSAMDKGTEAHKLKAAGVALGRLPQLAQLFALEDRLAALEAAEKNRGTNGKQF